MSDPIEAEFIPAAVAPHRCHCPACPALIASGNFCELCLATCVPTLRELHAARFALVRASASASALSEGARAAAELVGDVRGVLDALTGRRRPRGRGRR